MKSSILLLLVVALSAQQLTLVWSLSTSSSSSNIPQKTNSESPSPAAAVTIQVCTGADCRVDGASDCLRALQQNSVLQQARKSNQSIRVQARACLGPCGDGPCVVVRDNTQDKKVVVPRDFQDPKCLVPPNAFGDSTRGVYQVRTAADVDFVVNLAARTGGIETGATTTKEDTRIIITPTRTIYDRPRNERKVLQRLMQFLVVVGLYQASQSNNGVIDTTQWRVAVGLFVASNFIMKENLLQQLFDKARKKLK
jgi:hypothetical protein